MNHVSKARFPLLGAVLLATACVPMETRNARFEKKWPAAGITRLDVHEVNGTISVDGNSPGEISMIAVVRARGVRPDPKQEFDGYLRAELDGETLSSHTRNEY